MSEALSTPSATIRPPRHLASPVGDDPETDANGPEPGIALCLSGGGFRAMVFHLGALIRLNEAKLLRRIDRCSTVSGGSLVGGFLGLQWKSLNWRDDGFATNLIELVVNPIRGLASKTIDAEAILTGILSPVTVNGRIIAAYEEHLFRDATLQDLPSDGEGPRFVINATNVQSGALWRFSKPYMADYLVGKVLNPQIRLSVAIAASSAFPPVLSPANLKLKHLDFVPDARCPLQKPPFTTDVVLSDGGVYDNLGIETAWKRYRTILVSDGGGRMKAEDEPKGDWARHSYRILNLVDNQVRNLRKRQIISAFVDSEDAHNGCYWGIRTDISEYKLPDALPCPHRSTLELAEIPTRLKRLPEELQERLINWGYSVCDAAVRRYGRQALEAYGINVLQQPQFPYPRGV